MSASLRITSVEHALQTILLPALKTLLPDYPDSTVEIINDYCLADIVADRFDAGVRLGGQVAQDMIAVRIGPDFKQCVVGAPAYLKRSGKPRTSHDLNEHRCIALRLPTSGGVWSWPFEKDRRELKVRPGAQLAFNTVTLQLDSALAGLELGCRPEDVVKEYLAGGRLVRGLPDWSAPTSGYHLYYPSKRQPAPVFSLLVEVLGLHGENPVASSPVPNLKQLKHSVQTLDGCFWVDCSRSPICYQSLLLQFVKIRRKADYKAGLHLAKSGLSYVSNPVGAFCSESPDLTPFRACLPRKIR